MVIGHLRQQLVLGVVAIERVKETGETDFATTRGEDANDADILYDKDRVTAEIAKAFAESEFEKYRVIQDRLYQSDFDRLLEESELTEQ